MSTIRNLEGTLQAKKYFMFIVVEEAKIWAPIAIEVIEADPQPAGHGPAEAGAKGGVIVIPP